MSNYNQKRQIDYDDLVDFGFKPNKIQNGKVEYIRCTSDEVKDGILASKINNGDDFSLGSFFTLTDILSGGSSTVEISDVNLRKQAELALNYNISTSFAYFGSLYTTVQISINDIRENYPNGFLIVSSITGVNAIMFNSVDTYTYGGVPFKTIDNLKYEIVQTYNDEYDRTFQIIQEITGTTFSLFLELDGQPSDGPGYGHILQPKQELLDKFYSTLSKYSLNLLVPPFDRTNYWPRDLVAPSNILLDGDRYDEFIENELSWATESDNEESNFIWRKLYPDGQKNLDSEDGLIQRLVLTFAMNFDNIKRYQDQLKYQHTIGYDLYDHISRDAIGLISNQWNWNIGHTLNQDDYSEYVYSLYENYISGQSQQKISSKDINFEIQRRVLSNLITLYKKKGTKEAIKYIANMYGLPEELFVIDELVSVGDKNEIVESESNIVIPINGNVYYINDIGSAVTLTNRIINNTKFLNINISPFDAIDYDFYDWGSESHPNILNINGINTKISGSSDISKNDFFKRVYSNTIKSDGSSRYESNYPLLENEGVLYHTTSPNKITLSKLDPYINFLDDNWNILIGNLVPASSRILSIGTLYKNPMWRREKFQWNIDELTPKSLPVNETIDLPNLNFNIGISEKPYSKISIDEPIASIGDKMFIPLDSPTISSTSVEKLNVVIDVVDEVAYSDPKKFATVQIGNLDNTSYVEKIYDTNSIEYSYTSKTYNTDSPIFEPISDYGSLDYVNYNSNSLIVSNKKTVDIPFTAYNLSDSGYTILKFELFRKQYGNSVILNEDIDYRILSIEYENDRFGTYTVSTLDNVSVNDYISVSSNYLPYINQIVLVTHIDTGSSQIRTSPSIGLINIPLYTNDLSLNWKEFQDIGALDRLSWISKTVSIQNMIKVLFGLSNGFSIYDSSVGLNLEDSSLYLFSWFENKSINILYSAILILYFVSSNEKYTLSTKDSILISALILDKTKPSFKRVVDFFNWNDPVQTLYYSNYDLYGDDVFNLPPINPDLRTTNSFSTSGNVTIGGLNELNSDILVDKEEYFYRYKCETHVPIDWGNVDGLKTFTASGGSIIESDYDIRRINNITYYGRYFTFIRTPKMPNASLLNVVDNVLADASVTSIWNGVGDSDRLELQFLEVYSSNTPYSAYTEIPESAWTTTSGTIIPIQARKNIGDDYIYNVQTTLNGDTYYWWRVKNFRGKLNMFNNNLECSTTSKPTWFKTGEFVNIGGNEGEIPEEPIPPKKIGRIPDITS